MAIGLGISKPTSQSPLAMAREFVYAIRYAVKLLWQASPRYTLGTVATAILSAPGPAILLFIGKLIIDEVARATATGTPAQVPYLITLIVAQLLVLLISNVLQQLNVMFGALLGNAFVPALNDRILAKSNELDLAFFEDAEYYDALQRASQEAGFQPVSVLQSLINLVQGALGLVSFVIVLIGFSLWAIVALLVGAAVALFTQARYGLHEFLMLDWQVPAVRRLQYLFWLLTRSDAAKEVRLFDLGDYMRSDHTRGLHEQMGVKATLARKRVVQSSLTSSLSSVLFSIVYGALVLTAAQGQLTVGDLTLFVGAFQQSQTSLGFIVFSLAQIFAASLFLHNIEKFFSYQPKMHSGSYKPDTTALRDGLALRDVSFTYPNQSQPTLHDINLDLKPGQVLAVVGENGAGKTTLIKLICRLYDPTGGEITLDGIPLRDYDLHALRARFGALFQDFVQYQLTVAENIGYGDITRKDDAAAVEDAAVRAGASGFIGELPEGYATLLGQWFQGARDLSKGQWQLMALARALFRDASIIILDEPTAALSPSKEQEVFETLRKSLRADQIGIIVSHRFSTVRLADTIIVIEDGPIRERGSHDALMRLGGSYARLYTLQASAYAAAPQDADGAASSAEQL